MSSPLCLWMRRQQVPFACIGSLSLSLKGMLALMFFLIDPSHVEKLNLFCFSPNVLSEVRPHPITGQPIWYNHINVLHGQMMPGDYAPWPGFCGDGFEHVKGESNTCSPWPHKELQSLNFKRT